MREAKKAGGSRPLPALRKTDGPPAGPARLFHRTGTGLNYSGRLLPPSRAGTSRLRRRGPAVEELAAGLEAGAD